jgi:hypothetical protein
MSTQSLTPQQTLDVSFLQYLSSCFLQTTGVENYTALEEIGEYIGVPSSDPLLLETAQYLAANGYILLNDGSPYPLGGPAFAAVLSPDTWNGNSRQASLYSFFVWYAHMFGRQKQQRVQPGIKTTLGLAFPFQNSCQNAQATYFDGVIAPYPIETFCCPGPVSYPAEFVIPRCIPVCPTFSTTYNYRLQGTYSKFLLSVFTGQLAELLNAPWPLSSSIFPNKAIVIFAPVDSLTVTDILLYIGIGSVQKTQCTISGTVVDLHGTTITFANGIASNGLSMTYAYLGQSRNGAFLCQALTVFS